MWPLKTNIDTEITDGKTDNIKGLKLMSHYCLTCHNPEIDGGHDSRLGPPIFKVREHYYKEGISEEKFISSILNFVKNPSEDKTKMRGAIRNFGLMPQLAIPQEDFCKRNCPTIEGF
jgi:cytochrome c2